MRRTFTILGTLLIATVIIISGSSVAVFAHWIDYDDCTDWWEIDVLDGDYASIGEYIFPADPILGWILLDLGLGNEMGPGQDFIVYADTPINETYDVSVSPDTSPAHTQYVGSGWDTEDLIFQTPGEPFNGEWRYILIQGTSGVIDWMGGDYGYGPDIDAVEYP